MTLRTICLHGALKDFSADPFALDVSDVRDVFSALKSRFNGFSQFMAKSPNFAIVLSDEDRKNPRHVMPEFINAGFGDAVEVHVFPVTEGAGIEEGLAALFASWGASAATAATLAAVVINVAVSLAISAVANMLAPQTSSTSSGTAVTDSPSFLYNGPENVIEQGFQVPIVYGTAMTGSVVVSAGITVEQLPPDTTPPPSVTLIAPDAMPFQWIGMDGGGDGTGDSGDGASAGPSAGDAGAGDGGTGASGDGSGSDGGSGSA